MEQDLQAGFGEMDISCSTAATRKLLQLLVQLDQRIEWTNLSSGVNLLRNIKSPDASCTLHLFVFFKDSFDLFREQNNYKDIDIS